MPTVTTPRGGMMGRTADVAVERDGEQPFTPEVPALRAVPGAGTPGLLRAEKLVRWFIFSVLVSLTPLAFSYFSLRLDRRAVTLEPLVARGELLLICTSIAAAALGELIAAGRENAIRKLVAGGSCVLVVVLSSLYFAAIQARSHPDAASITAISLRLFFGMLLAAGCSLYFAHQEVP